MKLCNEKTAAGLLVALWPWAASAEIELSGRQSPEFAREPLDASTTLRLTFEQGFEAECAAGEPTPTVTVYRRRQPERLTQEQTERLFVPGLAGKGVTCADRDVELWLSFQAKGNLRARSATILWWFQIVTDRPGNWCGLMLHLGNLFVVAPPGHQAGTIMVHAQRPSGERLAQAYATFRPKPGEWHQLGVAWDSRSLWSIVDGMAAAFEPLRHPFADGDLGLTVTVAGWGGEDHDVVVLDELVVLNRLLAAKELSAEYQRRMTAVREPKTAREVTK